MKTASLTLASASCFSACLASTKGLNQIVTPDVQPKNLLSLSMQYQHPAVGNASEAQMELGLSDRFEVAYFQGLKPGIGLLASELGLIQSKHWLLSTGFVNLSTEGDAPQPFLEGGYYTDRQHWVLGEQREGGQQRLLAGYYYSVNPKVAVQVDGMGGPDNFTTFGVTLSPNSALSINPALYMANSSDHKVYPYLVVAYSMPWKL
jgi:hypothetical protein